MSVFTGFWLFLLLGKYSLSPPRLLLPPTDTALSNVLRMKKEVLIFFFFTVMLRRPLYQEYSLSMIQSD